HAGPDAVPQVVRTSEGTQIIRVPWRQTEPDPTPLEPRMGLEQLRLAADRDAVFHTLIRSVRSRTRYAASLVVQNEMAFGREALGENGSEPGVTQVAIPLAGAPAFRTAVASGSPYIGPIATGDRAVDSVLVRLGGSPAPTALILPVVIKTRVVAVVYAHRGRDALSVPEMAEILPLAGEAAIALGKLILKAKSAGYGRAVVPVPVAQRVDVEEVVAKRRLATESGKWRRASAPVAPVPSLAPGGDGPPAAADSVPPRRPIDQVFGDIENGGASAAPAYDEAVHRFEETVVALRRRLPGKLWVDRYASVRPTRASQHGPLLALL